MTFIPKAICHREGRKIVHIIRDEGDYERYWKGRVYTEDAPCLSIHPWNVKPGDVIDFYETGWTKTKVLGIEFLPGQSDVSGLHRAGFVRFKTEDGFRSVEIDGRKAMGLPLYIFPEDYAAAINELKGK